MRFLCCQRHNFFCSEWPAACKLSLGRVQFYPWKFHWHKVHEFQSCHKDLFHSLGPIFSYKTLEIHIWYTPGSLRKENLSRFLEERKSLHLHSGKLTEAKNKGPVETCIYLIEKWWDFSFTSFVLLFTGGIGWRLMVVTLAIVINWVIDYNKCPK